jgi:hypothetical protein
MNEAPRDASTYDDSTFQHLGQALLNCDRSYTSASISVAIASVGTSHLEFFCFNELSKEIL